MNYCTAKQVWQGLWIEAQSRTKAAPAVPRQELVFRASAIRLHDAAFCSSSELELFSYTAPGCADCRSGAVLLGGCDAYLEALVGQQKLENHFLSAEDFRSFPSCSPRPQNASVQWMLESEHLFMRSRDFFL